MAVCYTEHMSRIGSFLSKRPVYLTLAAILIFALGALTTVFIGRQTAQTTEVSTIATGPPQSLPPQPTADPSQAGKEISIKQLTADPTKYQGISIKLRGKIVQLTGQDGKFLRDAEGYTIKLDYADYQGTLGNATEVVLVTGKTIIKPESRQDPLVFQIEDIQKP